MRSVTLAFLSSAALGIVPALADGGAGSLGAGGAGGIDNPIGTGGPGSVASPFGVGGGGGGAGTTGGPGSDGSLDPVFSSGTSGTGGPGGSAPGASGTNGGDTSNSGAFIAGGGGGGGAHGSTQATLPLAVSTGGNGGNGGNGLVARSDGGGGGAGGYGAVVTGSGLLGSLGVAVTGGKGGNGGNSGSLGGNAGSGGIGLFFSNSAGATFQVDAAVQGGNGGSGGTGTFLAGANGPGGAGLAGQNLIVTVGSTGSITGGQSGDGAGGGFGVVGSNIAITNTGTISGGLINGGAGGRADAISFTGGTNALTLGSGGTTGTLRGEIGVSGSMSIDPGTAAGVPLSFTNIIHDGSNGAGSVTKSGIGTLVLTVANAYTGSTNITAGTLALSGPGSIATSSAVNLATGGTFDVSQTPGATITTLGNTAVGQTGTVALGGQGLTISNGSTTFAGVIKDGGLVNLTGGTLTLNGGTQTLSGINTYTGRTFIAGGTLALSGGGSLAASVVSVGQGLGTATLDISATTSGTSVRGLSGASDGVVNLGNQTLTLANPTTQFAPFRGVIQGNGGLIILAGEQDLGGTNTYTGVTTINSNATLGLVDGSIATSSKVVNNGSLDLSLQSGNTSISSLAGTNAGAHVFLGFGKDLVITAANDSFAGVISGSSGLTLSSGTQTLTGNNTYSGITTINGGRLEIDGTLSSAQVVVNNGGTLAGTGTLSASPVTINGGGTFAPGAGTPGTSMTLASLSLASGAIYMVQVNPTTSSFANITGAATPGGATVNAVFANGSYISRQYTILTAGSITGTFNPTVVNANLPSGFHTTLSYDTNNVFLNLALNFVPPPGAGLSGNQQGVGNAISNFFNTTGSIPMVFGGLTPAGLTQVSGETATGSQQATFNAMGLFMGLLTDPFMNRGGGFGAPPSSSGYAEENAYAAKSNPTDAFAMFTKAPPVAPSFEQRWSVWAAGFGGSQNTSGNVGLGSNNTTSSIAGTAVGADYLLSANTIAGFALAGGGTNFSVANGGTGRSDLFQFGAYVRHNAGPAYISAALAYGWQDITTNRNVTVAGLDQLRAQFNANAWSGRLEGGYRFVSPSTLGIGITPYAAAQFVAFDLPAYMEQVVSGTNNFALGYNAKDVTDARSELGIRTDKSWLVNDGILTLRGRLAWAHDFDPDRSIAATFQTLPGASFVVNGAAMAADSALTTASIEMKWRNGWSVAGTFEGEFSNVTNSYAGKGVVRYAW
jgi:autotransporter-associated beta strand protein